MKRFSELCNCISDHCDPAESGVEVYVGLEHIKSGAFFLSQHGTPSEVRSAKSRFKKGDVLYGKLRPYLDKAVIAPGDGICSTDILVFRALPDVCSPYLLGLVHSREFLAYADQTTHGVNHPRTSWSGLSEFSWNVPPEAEQEKIAAVLWNVQRAIEVEEKLIATSRELRQSTMQQLFTRGLRNESPKETEIGVVPDSWQPTMIEDFGEVVTGTTPRTAERRFYEGGSFHFIAPGDMGATTRIYRSEKFITEDGLGASRVLPRNTVCFVCIGSSIGKVGITTQERSTTNQQINSIIVSSRFDPFFVCYLLNYFSTYVSMFASPSPVPIMSKGKFQQVLLYAPSDKNEQSEIAHILSQIDAKIEIHERKRGVLQQLFKATLHQLMTGQIRVHDLDIDLSGIRP